MTNEVVKVPASLLLNPDLPASAKLTWMVSQLHPATGGAADPGTTWLADTSGLSRMTVLKGLAQLTAAGWDPARTAELQSPTVPVPAALLTNLELGMNARVLYGLLLLTPGFCHPGGKSTYAGLADLAHFSRNTVEKALTELVRAEWVKVQRANRRDLIHFELTFPGLDHGITALAAAQGRLEKAQHYGEALMWEYLTLLIDSEEFQNNATPGFLVNPRTKEYLQLDRYYPPGVAFEFQGPQHFHATKKFTQSQVGRQQERDYIKLGICVARGVTLVTVLPEDLTLTAMQQKVDHLLPLRDLTGCDLLIDYLEAESHKYRLEIANL